MFISMSLVLYMFLMLSISINQQLLKFVFLDVEKISNLSKELKKIKRSEEYDQMKYVRTMQSKKDINFELIYYTIVTLIVMFSCLYMIEANEPLVVMGHKLGIFSIILLIITEGYILNIILNKLGIK